MTISVRIKAARAALGLTQAEAAIKFELPLGSLRKYESGPSEPGSSALAGIVRAGINANWLLTGDGPMLLADLATQGVAAPTAKINLDALEAIFEGSFIAAPKMPPAQRAALCVSIYQGALERGEITPDGIGSGNLSDAA